MGVRDRDFGVVHAEVAGDGVVIKVVGYRRRDITEQSVINELQSQVTEALAHVKNLNRPGFAGGSNF